jgi:hypothetical protein
MAGACSTHGGDSLESLGVYGRIISEWVLEK